jgi:hypothetical protein
LPPSLIHYFHPNQEVSRPNGQFLVGHTGYGGRRPGSRNKLTTEFLADLQAAWSTYGKTALERCATDDPVQFCKLVSGLLPAKAELDVSVSAFADATNVLEAFRLCSDLLGSGDPDRLTRRLRRVAPHLLEHVADD